MSRVLTLLIAAGLALAGYGLAQPPVPRAAAALTKDGYAEARKNADAQYKIDREACSSRSGNAKDICVAEAKAKKRSRPRRSGSRLREHTGHARERARG
jgi:hypothetical protein